MQKKSLEKEMDRDTINIGIKRALSLFPPFFAQVVTEVCNEEEKTYI